MSAQLVALCDAAAVTAETPLRVEHDDFGYAVFKLGDRYIVTADQCTHGPGQLSEGTIIGDEIECPFHMGRFDLRTGKPSYPPCSEAVRVWTAHLVDGQVCIDPGESR
jgi:ethylbenzene dioxygenase ferredoxin component